MQSPWTHPLLPTMSVPTRACLLCPTALLASSTCPWETSPMFLHEKGKEGRHPQASMGFFQATTPARRKLQDFDITK